MADKQPRNTNKPRGPGRPWKPGESGNPRGRPKKDVCLTTLAKAALEADPELAQKAVKKWLDQVVKGDAVARRELLDRLEGRVPVPVQAKIETTGTVSFTIGKGYDEPDDRETSG